MGRVCTHHCTLPDTTGLCQVSREESWGAQLPAAPVSPRSAPSNAHCSLPARWPTLSMSALLRQPQKHPPVLTAAKVTSFTNRQQKMVSNPALLECTAGTQRLSMGTQITAKIGSATSAGTCFLLCPVQLTRLSAMHPAQLSPPKNLAPKVKARRRHVQKCGTARAPGAAATCTCSRVQQEKKSRPNSTGVCVSSKQILQASSHSKTSACDAALSSQRAAQIIQIRAGSKTCLPAPQTLPLGPCTPPSCCCKC
mmetsp:Transcript_9248/g.22901  ORF Transcript_9248/g.22901 Transcript_9248/m.22901 type:complete len:253 (-) Transcript_9248:2096-2854(-)